MEESKEEAVPFLIYDHNTKFFTLTEQGEEIIKSLNSNFGVVSVAGMYRTGKSYLLNRMLLNKQKGFSVGPTVNPCTKGLWIWSKPIYGQAEDGSRIPVLILDTEGFGAFDEDQNHDIRIFTLSILLSSFFVYNSVGSIDENALQSLSFVINLSKHIQLKENTETDPEELADLFPSFLWVLRDFSLQLVDENGETITAKEYIEKVLDVSKTFYDQDKKNKIRKLIKTYFKDRDCFTMVRPLLQEKELQNLESLGPERLRPEFLEQILHLRKRILSRVKVKSFKGQPLTGDMYLGFIKSLINSINTGRVPNIENTWVSMCKVECYKAYEDAERFYENFIRDSLDRSNGLIDATLKDIHHDAKEKCIGLFKQKALGDLSGDYEKQLKLKIKEKFSYYSKLNEEETKSNIIRVLQKWYSILENKIQTNELRSVDEIESECKQLELKLFETFPSFNQRNELFNEFKSRILGFSNEVTQNKMQHEMKLLKNEKIQQINKLTQECNDIKTQMDKELTRKENTIQQVRLENGELKDKFLTIQEQMATVEKEKDLTAKSLNTQMDRMKDEYERKLNECRSRSSLLEEKQKEAERRAITVQAEAERDKALLDQKIEHYSKQIEEYSKREKETSSELKSHMKEQTLAYKENISKLEGIVRTITAENENLKEKVVDLESLLSNSDHLYQSEKSRADELSTKVSQDSKELNEKLKLLKKQLTEEKNKHADDLKSQDIELNSKIGKLKLKNEELELSIKSIEESLRNQIQKVEKENVVLRQENIFLSEQKDELSNQLDEQKKNYENIITTLENKAFSMVGHDEFQKKVDEIKQYFEKEKRQSEESFEKLKQIYSAQIDKLTEKLNEADYKLKVKTEEVETEMNDLRNKTNKATKDLNTAQNENKTLREQLSSSQEDIQTKLKQLQLEFEQKMEDKEQTHQRELNEMNRNSEETISQLKSLFETEKITFGEKLKEEKMRNERKMNNTIEDYEGKLKELEAELKEEIETIQGDYNELEANHQNYVSNTEQEFNIMNQKIEALETYLREAKEALMIVQAQGVRNLEQANEAFNKERKELQNKIDLIGNEFAAKEKECTTLNLKKDALERTILEKENAINQMRKDYEEDKKDLTNRLDALKLKSQAQTDEYMINKLEYTREIALLKQQIDFLNKKIDELNLNIEEGQSRYEERLFGLRAEVEKDLNEKFERVNKVKEELEVKLLQKKKEVKELELTFMKQNKQLEKEKTEINDKYITLESKSKEIADNYDRELKALSSSIQQFKDENTSMKDKMFNGDEYLKKKLVTLESELHDKSSTLEKEQILWEGKIKFVEHQRDTLKKNLDESQKRFDTLLDSIQKKANSDKEKLEGVHQSSISNLELKYQNQIKDMQESHSKLCSELMNSNKELEAELKAANLQLQRGKQFDPSHLEKRLIELSEERDALKKEIVDMRRERETKMAELQNVSEKEKDMIKSKATDIETRLREAEGRRGALLLEYEKDKAKWSLEKDHLASSIADLKEQLEQIRSKNDNLSRENEKLKADKNNMKRSSINSSKNFSMMNTSGIQNQTGTSSFNPVPRESKTYTTGGDIYQKEISKIIGSTSGSNILNLDLNASVATKFNPSEKSFDRYDSSKYSNPYNKFVSGFNQFGKEENGNSDEPNTNNK